MPLLNATRGKEAYRRQNMVDLDSTGQVNSETNYTPRPLTARGKKILRQFNEWADDRIAECAGKQSYIFDAYAKGWIDAKSKLARIIHEEDNIAVANFCAAVENGRE